MQSLPSELQIGAAQEQGDRKEQQDYFAVTDFMQKHRMEQGFLAILADGMGGHPGSGNASVIAVNTFVKHYNKEIAKNTTIQNALNHALTVANQAVFQANQKINANMGTTLVACVVQGKRFYWLSVGDSSLYLYTNGKLTKINKTHSYGAQIQEQIEAGILTREEAALDMKKRNMLTSYLGLEEIPKIDFSENYYELELGNKILLCSDGLDNALSEAQIEDSLRLEMMSQEKCDKLMANALGKNRPNQDNITFALLELEPSTSGSTIAPSGVNQGFTELRGKTGNGNFWQPWKKWFIPVSLILLLVVLLVGGGIWIYKDDIYSVFSKNGSEDEQPNATDVSTPLDRTETDRGNDIEDSYVYPDNRDDPHVYPSNEDRITGTKPENVSKLAKAKNCDNGLELRDIQDVLKEERYYNDAVDGDWGTHTKTAIEKYQKYSDIKPPSGYLNPKTCQLLLDDYNRLNPPADVPQHSTDQPF